MVTMYRYIALLLILIGWATARADFPDVIARVKPSIVIVGTFNSLASPQFSVKGAGFVVGDGNLVVTNAHVLGEGSESDNAVLTVVIDPGTAGVQMRRAAKVSVDAAHDLALIKFDGASVAPMKLAEASKAREGQAVGFTGFPIGGVLGFSPVTHRGFISAVTSMAPPAPSARLLNEKTIRSVKGGRFDVYQLDATAYPGNSGSPLFDIESGEVLGIINMVFIKGTRESALSQPSGISYAIPVAYLIDLMMRKQKYELPH